MSVQSVSPYEDQHQQSRHAHAAHHVVFAGSSMSREPIQTSKMGLAAAICGELAHQT